MRKELEPYKRFIFIGIITIALGVTFSTTMNGITGPLGTVFIAVGALLFITGMSKKHKGNQPKNK